MTTLYRYVFRSPSIVDDERGIYNWFRLFPYGALMSWEISHSQGPLGDWYEALKGDFRLNIDQYRHFFFLEGNTLFLKYDYEDIDFKILENFCNEYDLEDLELIRYTLEFDESLIPSEQKDKYQCVLPLDTFKKLSKVETVMWENTKNGK